ncbi:DUF4185 domain-containing protein [Mucilaginibacter panaciglaebae]|uniref:DUF4185 domain-containing protein n=1 Tax=Mucilaginibacter panaciglaebae TaxID=502331 RepID=A0ABP7X6L3_9SPHI
MTAVNKIIAISILLSIASYGYAQSPMALPSTDLTTLNYTVELAPEWTALLKRSAGWFGGDGIFTIPLNGVEHRPTTAKDKILFIFSDTMIGNIKDNVLMPGSEMIHNSAAILTGNKPNKDKMRFSWDTTQSGKPVSLFIPQTPKTKTGDYFWLGDGFVNRELNNSLYIFGYRIHNIDTVAFGFKEVGNVLIKIPAHDKPPYKLQQQYDTPFYIDGKDGNTGSFGAGIYVNTRWASAPNPDGYIYVYGVVGKYKNLLVARVKPTDFENYNKWAYWDGKGWSRNITKAAKIADWVSNELSVSPMPDGRYALIFQIGTITRDIGLRIGETPYGPFGPAIKIWDCSKDLLKKTYMVYNAKAHPSLSAADELLISYNINSTQFLKDLATDPNLYRPRFIKLKFNKH